MRIDGDAAVYGIVVIEELELIRHTGGQTVRPGGLGIGSAAVGDRIEQLVDALPG